MASKYYKQLTVLLHHMFVKYQKSTDQHIFVKYGKVS